MTPSHTDLTGNSILDGLPSSARRQCQKMLVELPAGTRVVGQGERITHVLFPTTAVCSMAVELASGEKAETCAVGRDGFVGVPLVLGVSMSTTSGVIQVPGEAYRIGAKQLLELCRQHESFRKALFGYSAFRLHLASRSVACNSFHSIQQRLARWLLFAHDRARKNEFHLTHEVLSAMLAASRPRVSQAAAHLRAAGIIAYRRCAFSIANGSKGFPASATRKRRKCRLTGRSSGQRQALTRIIRWRSRAAPLRG